jgi:hypothetical protein
MALSLFFCRKPCNLFIKAEKDVIMAYFSAFKVLLQWEKQKSWSNRQRILHATAPEAEKQPKMT